MPKKRLIPHTFCIAFFAPALGIGVSRGGIGALAFSAYIAALTATGLEQHQAFTALAHPGFEHFVRTRVCADGGALDLWCIGLVAPLAPDPTPVLVDAFPWHVEPLAAPNDDRKPPPSRTLLGHLESWV
ncbi:MAG TPA: hypothetical protein VFS43_28195 [Polyangiaceae bacterium]|nr:hypothetical protein [Polyangiaceae bacterium]